MATINIFRTPVFAGGLGTVTIANTTQIQIVSGTVTQNYYGIGFLYDQFAQVVGGTVTGTDLSDSSNGGLQYTYTGLSVSAITVYQLVVGGGNLAQFLSGGNDVINGSPQNDYLVGFAGSDSLVGGNGNDTLDGGMNNSFATDEAVDTLAGGPGDDIYIIDGSMAQDVIQESLNGGTDKVLSETSFTLPDGVENLTLRYGFNATGTGNDLNNHIIGNGYANALSGLGGSDTLEGSGGNDTFDGGSGNDLMVGSDGDDTFYVDSLQDTVNAGVGSDTIVSTVSGYALGGSSVEHLTLIGVALVGSGSNEANRLTGNELNNTLNGLGGDDTLDGGQGADTLAGGSGDDLYLVDDAQDVVQESGGGGTDTVHSTVSLLQLAPEVERLVLLGGTGALRGVGNALPNRITGNDYDNILEGAGGDDTLLGGGGSDDYIVNSAGDVVEDDGFDGTDTVYALASFDLQNANGVENITLLGTGDLDATGNAGINTITGNSGNNRLTAIGGGDQLLGGDGLDHLIGSDSMDRMDGGSGADTMEGGFGFDQYWVDDLGDHVVEVEVNNSDYLDIIYSTISYTLPQWVELLTLTGTAEINGFAGVNDGAELTGNEAANRLEGGHFLFGLGGNDTLVGGDNTTRMEGGPGNDTYIVNNGLYFYISELEDEGVDTLEVVGSATLPNRLENLVLLSGTYGTGNADHNRITGNASANLLDGAAGVDTLLGGDGDDTYTVDTPDDLVTEYINEGYDKIQAVGAISYALAEGSHVEFLQLYGQGSIFTGAVGTGNSFANRIAAYDVMGARLYGGAGNDTLEGGVYAILLSGDAGNDSLTGGMGNDTLRGAENADTLIGGDGDDSLAGGKGMDSVDGGEGNDTLSGGVGADILMGGNGTDRVDYSLATEGVAVNLTIVGVAQFISTGQSSDTLSGLEHITGSNFPDALTGDAGANSLLGLLGNDTLIGNEGFDTLDGGDGNDLLAGGNNADSLLGGIGNDTLGGGKGVDTLDGADGDDVLTGALGADLLTGGIGADRFVFNAAIDSGTNIDTITDFTAGVDVIQLSAAIFGAFSGQVGQTIGTGANLSYNSGSGVLAYDADGAGGASPLAFAILGSSVHPASVGADFLIVA